MNKKIIDIFFELFYNLIIIENRISFIIIYNLYI